MTAGVYIGVSIGIAVVGIVVRLLIASNRKCDNCSQETATAKYETTPLTDDNVYLIGEKVLWNQSEKYDIAAQEFFVVKNRKLIQPPAIEGIVQPSYYEYVITYGNGDEERTFGYINDNELAKLQKEE